jgi:two-component system nitrate/nitrite response regulator NarL
MADLASIDPAGKIRLVLIDDHAMFRASVRELLNRQPEFTVAAHFGDTRAASEWLAGHPADVILLDIDLGGVSAEDFVFRTRTENRSTKILIVTGGVSEQEAVQLIRLGVAGILHKHNPPEFLCAAIRKVAQGEVQLEPGYLRPLMNSVDAFSQPTRQKLTDRDRLMLRGLFQGLANKEIAGRLQISEGAVKASLRLLFQKFKVQSRSHLVRIALEEYKDQL